MELSFQISLLYLMKSFLMKIGNFQIMKLNGAFKEGLRIRALSVC